MYKDLAVHLQKEIGWEPCYWTAHPNYVGSDQAFQDAVKSAFPDVIFHDNYDAVKGIPPKEFVDLKLKPDDEELIKSLSFNILETMKMMDRMDPLFIFDYNERKELVYYYVSYWTAVLDQLNPDILFVTVTPHLMYDYILYSLCRQRGIKTVMFYVISLHDWLYLRETHDEMPEYLMNIYEQEKQKESIVLTEKSEQYLQTNSGDYSEAIPEYIKKQISDQKAQKGGLVHLLTRIFFFGRYYICS